MVVLLEGARGGDYLNGKCIIAVDKVARVVLNVSCNENHQVLFGF